MKNDYDIHVLTGLHIDEFDYLLNLFYEEAQVCPICHCSETMVLEIVIPATGVVLLAACVVDGADVQVESPAAETSCYIIWYKSKYCITIHQTV